MPAGVSWSSYLKMFAASLLAMCAGAEVVHRYYRPDLVSAGESLRLASGPLHFHSGKVQFSGSVMSNSLIRAIRFEGKKEVWKFIA